VSLINQAGGRAVGLTGKDGGLIQAKKLTLTKRRRRPERPRSSTSASWRSDPRCGRGARALDAGGFVPVIAPVGVGAHGLKPTTSTRTSWPALWPERSRPEKLILLTDQAGIWTRTKPHPVAQQRTKVESMVKAGTVSGGMLPRPSPVFRRPRAGCAKVHSRWTGPPRPVPRDLHRLPASAPRSRCNLPENSNSQYAARNCCCKK